MQDLHAKSKEDLIDVISSLRKENGSLLEELACSVKERDSLKKVMEKYDFKLAKLKDETYKLQDEIQDRETENEELRISLKKLKKKSKIKETTDDVTAKLSEKEECDKCCECNRMIINVNDIKEGEDKENKGNEDPDEGESELQKVIDDMTEECRMRQDSIDELEEELEEKVAVIEDLQHQIERLENSLSKYESQNKEEDSDSTKIDELNFTITEMEDRIDEMSNEKQKLVKRIQDLQTCLAEQDLEIPVDDIEGVSPRSANSALRILKTQYLRLRKEHSSVTDEYAQLQEEIDLLKKEMEKNVPSPDGEIRMSSNQETTSNKLSESFIRKYEELQKELNKNKEETDKLIMLHHQAVQEKNKTQQYILFLQAQNADLDRQSKSFSQNLEGLLRDKAELQRKVNNLQLQLQTLQTTTIVSYKNC